MQIWFTDVLGTPKSFQITPAELENALDEGMTFDGSAIDGFSRVQESDVLAMPDAEDLPAPSVPGRCGAPVARVVCDVVNLDGSPFEGTPATCSAGRSSGPAWPRLLLLRGARARVLLLRPARTRPPALRPFRSTEARTSI